jgi:3-deoxy-7-phosphoheptulonate synthase
VDTLLPSPLQLHTQLPAQESELAFVSRSRAEIRRIIHGQDTRMLLVVGPCSIHDPEAALDYAHRLHHLRQQLINDVCIVMRVYCQKPRSHYGWKGLINDPHCDDSCDLNAGLYRARQLMLDITRLKLPIATEWLDPFTLPYLSDLVSWGAIGARTAESQIHREMASMCGMPIGFKNNPDGNIKIAVDGMRSATRKHSFMGVNKNGQVTALRSEGNPDLHLILRGSKVRPNYFASDIQQAELLLHHYALPPRVMVDCSHGNSGKDPAKQIEVAEYCLKNRGAKPTVFGLMLESFLLPGRQSLNQLPLRYGQSITDGCLSWVQTEKILKHIALFQDHETQSPCVMEVN